MYTYNIDFMNINEFVTACGEYTKQKQKLASLIIKVDQSSISIWLKKGIVPINTARQVCNNTAGIINLSDCNPMLKNEIRKISNPKTILKMLIEQGDFDVKYLSKE